MTNFGKALRRFREKKGFYLKNVSDIMGWSVVYLSDIERGNRKPPSKNDIIKLAKFLDVDFNLLLNLSDKDKGYIELDLKGLNKNHSDTALSLARQMEHLGDDQWEKIKEILKKRRLEEDG